MYVYMYTYIHTYIHTYIYISGLARPQGRPPTHIINIQMKKLSKIHLKALNPNVAARTL